jgi:glucose-1-phosphate cytidylyltransferase
MKVVLFCGGLGMRLQPNTEGVPKPLVTIGEKPILWNIMKYYSYFGHNDFILCLGYKAEQIKRFFLEYNECLSNDFMLSKSGKKLYLLNKDIENWKITFLDTGLDSNIGQRLKATQKYLDGEEAFLANYSDGVTDLHLPSLIDFFQSHNKIGCFITVKPSYAFHIVSRNKDGYVTAIRQVGRSNIRINGGYFVFKNSIFDNINEGEELVDKPFGRLIGKRELVAYEHQGFWASMDTYKDKQQLDELSRKNRAPWHVWRNGNEISV